MVPEILSRLAKGPATNRDLQRATGNYWSGAVSRTMAKLIARGKAARVDGQRGRGSRATYALREAD